MGGVHDGAIRVANSDGLSSDAFINNVCGDSAEMCSATAIGDGGSIWRDNGGGTYMSGGKTSATGSV
jgi:hypothetical protein